MKKALLICLSVLFFFLTDSQAQNYLGLHFNNMQPLKDYSKNLDAQPKGISIDFIFKPKIFKHLYVGAQLGVSMYATDKYKQEVYNYEDEIIEIEISEEDCFLSYGVISRYVFNEDKLISPYVEARLGGLSFFRTKMTEDEYDEFYENSTVFHGTALQLGIGAGMTYHVVDNLYVDLNVIYNNGTRTDYRNIGSSDVALRVDQDFGKFESFTDNLNYSLGVQFGF